DAGALMAGGAAIALEQPVALLLVARDGGRIAAQVAVEARVGRLERALEADERVQHLSRNEVSPIDGGEGASIAVIAAQLFEQLRPRRVHDARIEQRRRILLLKREKVATPVQPEVERDVEDRRGVEVERPAVAARGMRPIIVAAALEEVAGG